MATGLEQYRRTNTLLNKKFLQFLIPTLLNNTALSLSAVIDNILVGNLLGETELAAMGIAFPFISGINMLALVFIIGGVILASSSAGSQDLPSANGYFTISFFGGATCLVLFGGVFVLFGTPVFLALSNGDAQLSFLAQTYIRPILFSGFLIYLTNCLSQFTLAEGRVRLSVTLLLVANVADFTLGYIFMGPLQLGIVGAGLSTAFGYMLGFACAIPYLASKKRMFRFTRPPGGFWRKQREIFRAGLSPFLEQGAILIRTLVLNIVILTALGQDGMTAMTVIVSVQNVIQIVTDGTSNALTPIISSLSGERDLFGIRNVTKYAVRILAVTSLAISAFFICFPNLVAAAFGVADGSAAEVVAAAISLYAASFVFYGLNNAFQNIYNALGRAGISTYIAFMQNSVFVIAFVLLFLSFDPNLIWLGFLGADTATLISVAVYIRIVRKKEQVRGFLLLKDDEPEPPDNPESSAVWDTTIPAKVKAATDLSAKVMDFCAQNGLDAVIAQHAGIAVEEMAVNIALHGAKKKSASDEAAENKSVIDILIKIVADKLIIRIRDDGVIFDPLSDAPQQGEEAPQLICHGIDMVKKLASGLEYNRALGLNNTLITIDLGAVQTALVTDEIVD
jgi:Na+-driven multidrug efflux pump/anti-sigma regulatory factor (Ser/Thr protein kinase)